MDREHKRRCWDCGNVAVHEDNITPHVLCKKCGSQDTRRISPDFKHSHKLHPSPEMEAKMDKSKQTFPLTIGGRDIDLSQIGYTLRHELRASFPINAVPDNLVGQVEKLIDSLKEAEADIEHFIACVRRYKDQEDFMSN